jgi:hypothetical protein
VLGLAGGAPNGGSGGRCIGDGSFT